MKSGDERRPAPEGGAPPVTIKELRRNPAWAPGGDQYRSLVTGFLPLVYGSASILLPENPEAAQRVAVAVFEAFGVRWRRIPPRTVVASWLVRSTWFAAVQARQRLGLTPAAQGSAAALNQILFRRLNRLRPAELNVLVLGLMLGEPSQRVAEVLRTKEGRVRKRAERALKRLAGAARKRRVAFDPAIWREAMVATVPPELTEGMLASVGNLSPAPRINDLRDSILRRWRWVRVRQTLKRLAVAGAVAIALLMGAAGTFIWLAHHGYLTAWMLRKSSRDLARDLPELSQPARPWPVTAEDRRRVPTDFPATAAELYSLTNIWPAKLSFSTRQWTAIEPSSVPPVRNFIGSDGRITLRNPKASRSGLAGVLGIDFNWVEAHFEFAGRAFPRVAARYRGNGTYVNSLFGPKQSFKVDLNKHVKNQSIAGVDELNFLNAIVDSSYLHDTLAQELFRALGAPGPRTAFTYLTLNVPGKFTNQALGLYVLMENIDGDFAADRFGTKATPILARDWRPGPKARSGVSIMIPASGRLWDRRR